MFYQESQINLILNCKRCNSKYNEKNKPKVLPCGHNLCFKCEDLLKTSNVHFRCNICNEIHNFNSKEILPECHALVQLISLKPNKIHRSNEVNDLCENLNSIRLNTDSIRDELSVSVDKVKDHCSSLKNEVQLSTEIRIQQINSLNEQLINEINEYEKECSKHIMYNEICKNSDLGKQLKESSEFYSKWNDYLDQFQIDDNLVKEKKEESKSLVAKLNMSKSNLDNFIFKGFKAEFITNKHPLNEYMIGFLSKSLLLDSSILNQQQISELMSMFSFESNPKWTLVYKATQDGLSETDFHSKCDKYSKLLVVIKSNENEILGGYTDLNWKVERYIFDDVFKNDEKAFFFRFEKNKLQMKSYKNGKSIKCHNLKGPCFGESDLDINLIGGTLSSYDNYAFTKVNYFSTRFFHLGEMEVFCLNYR